MTKTKTKKEVSKKEVSKKDYYLEASVNDVVFKTKAESILEALKSFIQSPDYPFGAKTKLFFTYGKGKDERHHLYHAQEARRLLLTLSHKPTAIDVLAAKFTRNLES